MGANKMNRGPLTRQVELTEFYRADMKGTEEASHVRGIAHGLLNELNKPDVLSAIEAADQPRRSSALVQEAILPEATLLGFASERTGLFASYDNRALRPDYFLPLRRTSILLEVERGKTTINNMDLLDFCKCQICHHADYLFLLVPKTLRQNDVMMPKSEFAAVKKRLGSFFQPGNDTNVRGLALFGY